MYTIVQKNNETPVITYTTPCGSVVRIAEVVDIGTSDERVKFIPVFGHDVPAIPFNTIKNVFKLLESGHMPN